MKLTTGTKVRWSSAAGNLTGEIVNIILSLNGAQQTVPWIDIKVEGKRNTVRLCATDSNLKMMKVAVVTEDEPEMVERTNYMTGKKYMESVNTPYCCSPANEVYWTM